MRINKLQEELTDARWTCKIWRCMKQAGIYVNDVFCGILTEDEEEFHFLYDKTYLVRPNAAPVSPTMPLTEMRSRGR
jgi:hypothetical protein